MNKMTQHIDKPFEENTNDDVYVYKLFINEIKETYYLQKGDHIIGRDDTCNIQIIKSSISRKHALIRVEGDGVTFIKDIGSINGTYRNGVQLQSHVMYELNPNNIIIFGDIECSYIIETDIQNVSDANVQNLEQSTQQSESDTLFSDGSINISDDIIPETQEELEDINENIFFKSCSSDICESSVNVKESYDNIDKLFYEPVNTLDILDDEINIINDQNSSETEEDFNIIMGDINSNISQNDNSASVELNKKNIFNNHNDNNKDIDIFCYSQNNVKSVSSSEKENDYFNMNDMENDHSLKNNLEDTVIIDVTKMTQQRQLDSEIATNTYSENNVHGVKKIEIIKDIDKNASFSYYIPKDDFIYSGSDNESIPKSVELKKMRESQIKLRNISENKDEITLTKHKFIENNSLNDGDKKYLIQKALLNESDIFYDSQIDSSDITIEPLSMESNSNSNYFNSKDEVSNAFSDKNFKECLNINENCTINNNLIKNDIVQKEDIEYADNFFSNSEDGNENIFKLTYDEVNVVVDNKDSSINDINSLIAVNQFNKIILTEAKVLENECISNRCQNFYETDMINNSNKIINICTDINAMDLNNINVKPKIEIKENKNSLYKNSEKWITDIDASIVISDLQNEIQKKNVEIVQNDKIIINSTDIDSSIKILPSKFEMIGSEKLQGVINLVEIKTDPNLLLNQVECKYKITKTELSLTNNKVIGFNKMENISDCEFIDRLNSENNLEEMFTQRLSNNNKINISYSSQESIYEQCTQVIDDFGTQVVQDNISDKIRQSNYYDSQQKTQTALNESYSTQLIESNTEIMLDNSNIRSEDFFACHNDKSSLVYDNIQSIQIIQDQSLNQNLCNNIEFHTLSTSDINNSKSTLNLNSFALKADIINNKDSNNLKKKLHKNIKMINHDKENIPPKINVNTINNISPKINVNTNKTKEPASKFSDLKVLRTYETRYNSKKYNTSEQNDKNVSNLTKCSVTVEKIKFKSGTETKYKSKNEESVKSITENKYSRKKLINIDEVNMKIFDVENVISSNEMYNFSEANEANIYIKEFASKKKTDIGNQAKKLPEVNFRVKKIPKKRKSNELLKFPSLNDVPKTTKISILSKNTNQRGRNLVFPKKCNSIIIDNAPMLRKRKGNNSTTDNKILKIPKISDILNSVNNVLTEKTRQERRSSLRSTTDSPCISNACQKFIIFSGIDGTKYENIIKKLGGEITNDTSIATHLIMNKMKRTVKFMCCVARGIYIVTSDWLLTCQRLKCFISTNYYILKEGCEKYNFDLQLTLQAARSSQKRCNGILNHYKYLVFVTMNTEPGYNDLEQIISFSGGKSVLISDPNFFDYINEINFRHICIGNENDLNEKNKEIQSRFRALHKKDIDIVSVEFLFAMILEQKHPMVKKFKITINK